MALKYVFRAAVLMLVASMAHADVIISNPSQLKNLTVTEVSGQNGSKYYQLTMVYTLADGSIGNADVSCDSKTACQKLKTEIATAVNKGKSVLLNFDNQKTVAQILDAPKPDNPNPAGRVVCGNSDANLVSKLRTGFTITMKNDVAIPENADKVQLNESCFAKLKEAWAQPRTLKARSFSAFLDSPPLQAGNNNPLDGTYLWCNNGDFNHGDHCHHGANDSGESYRPVNFAWITMTTPLDRSVEYIACYQQKSRTKDDEIKPSPKMEFWDGVVKAGDKMDTSIGKAEACTKPVEAFLFGDRKKHDDALAIKEDSEGGVKNTKSSSSYGSGSTKNDANIEIML